MAEIKNVTQGLAIANTLDEQTFEHSVLVVAYTDDIRHNMNELELTLLHFTMAAAPLGMLKTYFEWFAGELMANEAQYMDEALAAEMSEKLAGETEAISDKLREAITAIASALESMDAAVDMTVGMTSGTKDLVAHIKKIINN